MEDIITKTKTTMGDRRYVCDCGSEEKQERNRSFLYFYTLRLSAGAFDTLGAPVAGTNSFVTGLVTRLCILV